VLVIAIAPLLYSLNRGAWVGAILSVGYLAVRLAARGKKAMLGGICAVLVASVLLVLLTPLSSVVTSRLQNGKSNDLRTQLSGLAVTDGLASPIIGYGDTRQEQGSPASIAVGPSAKCPTCGQLPWAGVSCAAAATVSSAPVTWPSRLRHVVAWHDYSPFACPPAALLPSFWYIPSYDATAPLDQSALRCSVKNDEPHTIAATVAAAMRSALTVCGRTLACGRPGECRRLQPMTAERTYLRDSGSARCGLPPGEDLTARATWPASAA
jgi:hypothetical protein